VKPLVPAAAIAAIHRPWFPQPPSRRSTAPGSLRPHRASRIGTLRARILRPPKPMAAFAAGAMLPKRPPPPP
jgi:hypothetical protein